MADAKKSLFGKVLDSLDGKLAKKAKAKSCCSCCCSSDDGKDKGCGC